MSVIISYNFYLLVLEMKTVEGNITIIDSIVDGEVIDTYNATVVALLLNLTSSIRQRLDAVVAPLVSVYF